MASLFSPPARHKYRRSSVYKQPFWDPPYQPTSFSPSTDQQPHLITIYLPPSATNNMSMDDFSTRRAGMHHPSVPGSAAEQVITGKCSKGNVHLSSPSDCACNLDSATSFPGVSVLTTKSNVDQSSNSLSFGSPSGLEIEVIDLDGTPSASNFPENTFSIERRAVTEVIDLVEDELDNDGDVISVDVHPAVTRQQLSTWANIGVQPSSPQHLQHGGYDQGRVTSGQIHSQTGNSLS